MLSCFCKIKSFFRCILKDSCLFVQIYAFVAPKIIGGVNAPSPVGELGMAYMSQALELIDKEIELVSFAIIWHLLLLLLLSCCVYVGAICGINIVRFLLRRWISVSTFLWPF